MKKVKEMTKMTVCMMMLAVAVVFSASGGTYSLMSPDGRNEIRLETGDKLVYSVWRDGAARVAPTEISLTLKGFEPLGPGADATDTEDLVTGGKTATALWKKSVLDDSRRAKVSADLSFLGGGRWKAEIFEDGVNADHDAEDYVHRFAEVDATRPFSFEMAPGGGFTMRIERSDIQVKERP